MNTTTNVLEKDLDAAEHLSLKVGENTKHEIKTAFDYLIAERKNWQENEYARSTQRLYTILQQCYALYHEMKGVSAEKLAMKRAFNSYCTDIDLPIKERDKVISELQHMGITPGSLFPGYDGTCEEIKQRLFKI